MLCLASLVLLFKTAAADPAQGVQLRGTNPDNFGRNFVGPLPVGVRRLAQYEYVDGPRVADTAWRGPLWPDVTNCFWHEVNENFNYEEAVDFCNQNENCTVLHDYMCDQINWRYCRVDLDALASMSPRTGACTKLKIPVTITQTETETTTDTVTTATTTTTTITTTKTTTSTSTLEVDYMPCPHVANEAWLEHCNTTWYGSLSDAKAKCNQDPNCLYLHDWNCDENNWRFCYGNFVDIQTNTKDTKACTMCKMVPQAFVDGPMVANQAWEDGNCHDWTGSLHEAQMKCMADFPTCTVLHDFGCNNELWRYCKVPLNVIQEVEGTGACTQVLVNPTTTTTTTKTVTTQTTTTTTTMNYQPGPHVNCRAWRKHCYTTLYSSKEEAQLACDLDSNCSVLFDWGCDGRHIRICYSDITEILDEGPGDCCTTLALPATMVSDFVDGPNVSNHAWHGMCSQWSGSLEDAVKYCNRWPNCNALHDFDCDGWSYRYCFSNIKALTLHSDDYTDRMACTKERKKGKMSTYTPGPKVTNRAQKVHCNQTWYGTLEEAEALCDMDATCTVLHDWGCDGQNWRYCFTDLRSLQDEYDLLNDDACTMIAPQFVYMGTASSCVYTHCSEWSGTMMEAEKKCIDDVNCNTIFDYACDGFGWRTCSANLEELQADTCKEDAIAHAYANAQAECATGVCITTTCPPPVEDACVFSRRKIVTTTTTSTMCRSGVSYLDGPRVGNIGHKQHCSEWFGTYQEAKQRCTCDPECMGLHDWNCDGVNWRVCHTSVETIMNETNGTEACTKVWGTSTSTTNTQTTTTVTRTSGTTTTHTVTATSVTTTATTTTETTTTTVSTTTKTTTTVTDTTTSRTTVTQSTTTHTTTHTSTTHTSITETDTTHTTTVTTLTETTHTTVTQTTTTLAPPTETATSTIFYYEYGPDVSNVVWKNPAPAGGSNCYWDNEDQLYNIDEAQYLCNLYPNCTVLHDYLADEINWRYCQVPIETLIAQTAPASQRGHTMLKQPASSRCTADPSCNPNLR